MMSTGLGPDPSVSHPYTSVPSCYRSVQVSIHHQASHNLLLYTRVYRWITVVFCLQWIVLVEFVLIPKYVGTIYKMFWFYFYTIFKDCTVLPKTAQSTFSPYSSFEEVQGFSYKSVNWFWKEKVLLVQHQNYVSNTRMHTLPANLLGESNSAHDSQSCHNGLRGPKNLCLHQSCGEYLKVIVRRGRDIERLITDWQVINFQTLKWQNYS
jgi:hypothetical protein